MKLRTSILLISSFLQLATGLSQNEVEIPEVMQGPMIGAVMPRSINVWMRVSGNYECKIEYDTDPSFAHSRLSQSVRATKSNYYTLEISLDGLKPYTRYYYRIYLEGEIPRNIQKLPPFYTSTAPEIGAKKDIKVAFGSCARYEADPVQRIWTAVEQLHPDLFFWLGDNIYSDVADVDIMAEKYERQREVVSLRPLLRSVPNLAIWDDHDFGFNNSDRTNPIKQESLKLFKDFWANPSYGQPANPGVYFKYSYGAVDFFFLDCRFYRDPYQSEDANGKTILGQVQLEWLKKELKESKGVFKVLISGHEWEEMEAGHALNDSWASYLEERNAVFDYIQSNKINGVVLLSGDTHVGELKVVPWSEKGGYDLYDLVSSPLAQETSKGWLKRDRRHFLRRVYFNDNNAGVLQFHLDTERPYLQFNLINTKGELVWKPFKIYADQLVNGVSSWEEKVEMEDD